MKQTNSRFPVVCIFNRCVHCLKIARHVYMHVHVCNFKFLYLKKANRLKHSVPTCIIKVCIERS